MVRVYPKKNIVTYYNMIERIFLYIFISGRIIAYFFVISKVRICCIVASLSQ